MNSASNRTVWGAVALVFLLGLLLRVMAMDAQPNGAPSEVSRWQPTRSAPYLENDEKIYRALTEQIRLGQGYTLQGHPILEEPWIVREQYDRPLFFHPPGGVAFFWLMDRLLGPRGLALAQILSFAIFFWSAVLMSAVLLRGFGRPALLATAVLAAFTPIMAHVGGRFWLDGPLLAFATAAAAVYLLGLERQNRSLVCLAAGLLGYASLIKLTALFIIPAVLVLGWVVTPPGQRRGLMRSSLLFVSIAGLIQLPWEVWQWRVVGNAFPTWAGRPAEQLVQSNAYINYLTVVRSPWIYVTLLPQVTWTLVPAVALWAAQWRNREVRRRGAALLVWILLVVGIHVGLGAIGYSKVLRYVILVTPATVLLFGLGVGGVAQTLRERRWLPGGRAFTIALLLVAAGGLGLEVLQGVQTSMVDNRKADLIHPLPILSSDSP